jgi:hypothetical protein
LRRIAAVLQSIGIGAMHVQAKDEGAKRASMQGAPSSSNIQTAAESCFLPVRNRGRRLRTELGKIDAGGQRKKAAARGQSAGKHFVSGL